MNSLIVDYHISRGSFQGRGEFRCAPGSRVGVVGPNGCGKTSIFRAIAGLDALHKGTITFNQQVWVDTATKQWVPTHRRNIGYVFQDYRLFPHLTVLNNVAFGLRHKGHTRDDALATASELLTTMECADLSGRYPDQLSGGQAQRIALARSLVTQPPLLLLDEPLSAFDAHARQHMHSLLQQLLSTMSSTTLFVSHDVREVRSLATHLLVIDDGGVAQSGPASAVMDSPATAFAKAFFA